MTPNDIIMNIPWRIGKSFDVICDKPMTNTLEEAEILHKRSGNRLNILPDHNYTGYPWFDRQRRWLKTTAGTSDCSG